MQRFLAGLIALAIRIIPGPVAMVVAGAVGASLRSALAAVTLTPADMAALQIEVVLALQTPGHLPTQPIGSLSVGDAQNLVAGLSDGLPTLIVAKLQEYDVTLSLTDARNLSAAFVQRVVL